jgi:Xaa-Pro dipeptidase
MRHELSPVPAQAPPVEHTRHVLQRLRTLMEREGLDAMIACGAQNHFYVTGLASPMTYHAQPTGCCFAVVFRDDALGRSVIDSEFMIGSYDDGLGDMDLVPYPTWIFIDNPFNLPEFTLSQEKTAEASVTIAVNALVAVLKDKGVNPGNVGIDFDLVSAEAWEALTTGLGKNQLQNRTQLFYEARSIKSEWEIANIKTAYAITVDAVREACGLIREGVTAWQLDRRFRAAVAADPRSTDVRFTNIAVGKDWPPVHWQHRKVPASDGDVVKFDLGAEVNGYGADIARTYVVGQPRRELTRVHAALLSGHRKLVEGAAPGRPTADLFDEVVAHVRAAGIPHYSRGHLGHSTGLQIEEAPHVTNGHTGTVFQPGMVFSLETPYYGYGVGGVNIEDMIVVNDGGCDVLGDLPKELDAMPEHTQPA